MSIEAMKQALKFMHAAQFSVEDYIATEAALVAAIQQAEKYDQTALELCKECGWRALIPGEGCLTCARQKAKPVAWVESPHGAIRANPLYKIPVPQSATWSIPLYAHPPTTPRQWVGLTDEEVDEFYWISALTVEAIEAKLKEKNT